MADNRPKPRDAADFFLAGKNRISNLETVSGVQDEDQFIGIG